MSDKQLVEILQAEALERLWNLPEWAAVVRVEEELKERLEKTALNKRPEGTIEEFAKDHIYFKGQRDAIILVWQERQKVLNRLKKKDSEDAPKKR
jgi:hypothetical protein